MKYLNYLKYILRHKYYVAIECFKMGLIWRGLVHDISKLRPSEFEAYAEYFYGTKKATEWAENGGWEGEVIGKYGIYVEERFNIAWNHHQKRNKHHWQYWLLKNDDGEQYSVGMPMKYLKEMLCDWRGAGMAINGKDNTKSWYLKNKDKIIIRKEDRLWIERQLNITK
jgi:Family of unknown function (DUF5662)